MAAAWEDSFFGNKFHCLPKCKFPQGPSCSVCRLFSLVAVEKSELLSRKGAGHYSRNSGCGFSKTDGNSDLYCILRQTTSSGKIIRRLRACCPISQQESLTVSALGIHFCRSRETPSEMKQLLQGNEGYKPPGVEGGGRYMSMLDIAHMLLVGNKLQSVSFLGPKNNSVMWRIFSLFLKKKRSPYSYFGYL